MAYLKQLGAYGGGGGGPYVDFPGAEDEWWEEAINWVVDLFGSPYPKPLPPPLPFSVPAVQEMLEAMPAYRANLVEEIERQGHTYLYLGRDPTPDDLQDPRTLAELGLWFANGTGDDLSRGEATIRATLIEGMNAYVGPGAGPGRGGDDTPGGQYPDPGGPTMAGAGGLLLAIGAGWALTQLMD